MNTHTEYRRHSHRLTEAPMTSPDTDEAASELAHHRDPSLRSEGRPPTSTAKGIAWIRPTELATYVAPMVGRGIDLHAELIRRARRTPAATTRALPRCLPLSAPGPANHTKGLSL